VWFSGDDESIDVGHSDRHRGHCDTEPHHQPDDDADSSPNA
jgi:hypothetical protein